MQSDQNVAEIAIASAIKDLTDKQHIYATALAPELGYAPTFVEKLHLVPALAPDSSAAPPLCQGYTMLRPHAGPQGKVGQTPGILLYATFTSLTVLCTCPIIFLVFPWFCTGGKYAGAHP